MVYGGILKDRKGMNVPGATSSIDAMTEKDLRDLEFGLSNNVDMLPCPSCVPTDREHVNATNPATKSVIAKLEKPQALEHLEEIIGVRTG